MTTVVFDNVRLIDPVSGLDQPGRLLVENGRITGTDKPGAQGVPEGATHVDGQGAVLCPGLVDMRVEIGEPGYEYRETIASATRAASAGALPPLQCSPPASLPLITLPLFACSAPVGKKPGP